MQPASLSMNGLQHNSTEDGEDRFIDFRLFDEMKY